MISFTSNGIAQLVASLRDNRRDLQNPRNSEYYSVTLAAQANIQERYDQVEEFREESGLPTPQPGTFSSDTSVSGGLAFFKKTANSIGIETSFIEDLVVVETETNNNPSLQAFIDKFKDIYPVSSTALQERKHLIAQAAAVVADEDDIIYQRLKDVHKYVRTLTK